MGVLPQARSESSKQTGRESSGSASDPFASDFRDQAFTPEETRRGPSRSEVKIWMRNFLRTPRASDPKAREALATLREIELLCGPYILASDILVFLRGISDQQFRAHPGARDRGYGLVSELLIRFAYAQLDAIRTEDKILGPSVFRGYCAEVLDALFARSHARKGVEAMVTMVDWLLLKSLTPDQHSVLYLELAHQAIDTTVDLTAVKVDEEERRERASVRAIRMATEDNPPATRYVASVDLGVLLYLREMQTRVHALQKEFEPLLSDKARKLSAPETTLSEQAEAALQEELLRLSAGVEHHVVSGFLSEQLGAALEHTERGSGLKRVRTAASYFELEAERELELKLDALARERFRRAQQLYRVAGDTAGFERVAVHLPAAAATVAPTPQPSG